MHECRPTRYDYMKHYLIDSENVGDFWIPLLDLPADKARLIVFYTKNSPHMSYDSLIKLKESDRTVTFIKCYEGTNALDFQLCTELGFLIAGNPGDEFIIVTNDTGYDAAVKYWRRKEYSVKRIAGKDSRTGSRRRGTPAKADVAAEVSAILHKLVKMPGSDTAAAQEHGADDERPQIPEGSADFSAQDREAVFEDGEEILDEIGDEEDVSEEDYEETDPDEYFDEYSEEEQDDEVSDDESEEDHSEASGEYEEEEPTETDRYAEPYEDSEEEPEEAENDADQEHEEIVSDSEEEASGNDPDDVSGSFDSTEQKDGSDGEPLNGSLNAENEAVTEEDESPMAAGLETGSDSPSDGNSSTGDPAASESEPDGQDGEDEAETEGEGEEFIPDPEEITAIVNCIGMENLAELHNQLIQFYGDNGKDIYLSLKSGALTIEKKDWDKEEKFLYYCALIFRHSDEPAEALTEENISEFAAFLLGAENKRKNLNSLRYALLKHYGKEKGRRYYFMLKPYVKALNQM